MDFIIAGLVPNEKFFNSLIHVNSFMMLVSFAYDISDLYENSSPLCPILIIFVLHSYCLLSKFCMIDIIHSLIFLALYLGLQTFFSILNLKPLQLDDTKKLLFGLMFTFVDFSFIFM